jgi:hypothetical protein
MHEGKVTFQGRENDVEGYLQVCGMDKTYP